MQQHSLNRKGVDLQAKTLEEPCGWGIKTKINLAPKSRILEEVKVQILAVDFMGSFEKFQMIFDRYSLKILNKKI